MYIHAHPIYNKFSVALGGELINEKLNINFFRCHFKFKIRLYMYKYIYTAYILFTLNYILSKGDLFNEIIIFIILQIAI